MTTIGAVQKVENLFSKYAEFIFEWTICNFFYLSQENKVYYCSPSFSFRENSWHLKIYPNGEVVKSGFISVYLCQESPNPCRKTSGPTKGLTWYLSLKTVDRMNAYERRSTSDFAECSDWGYLYFLPRSMLSNKRSLLVPSNILTLVCTIPFCTNIANNGAASFSAFKKEMVDKCISTHEQQCEDKPIRCPDCNNETTLRKCSENECPVMRVKAASKLEDDLVGIFNSEEYSDITIKVKEKEFHLHRNILAGRNIYFKALLNTEMKEKATGVISISGCEPDIFGTFIHFIYTGKINGMSSENVCDLYRLADMYHDDELKAQCLCFMKKHISVDNFCDFIVLAFTHNEKNLLKIATEFFCKNLKTIIKSVKWQSFMKQYPTQANELHIKAADYHNL